MGLESVKRIPVIRTKASYGKGTEEDPCRIVTVYWDDDGNVLWRDDPIEKDRDTRLAQFREGGGGMEDKSIKVTLVAMTVEDNKRVKAIPFEMEEALANNDKDRLSALVRELKRIHRSES